MSTVIFLALIMMILLWIITGFFALFGGVALTIWLILTVLLVASFIAIRSLPN